MRVKPWPILFIAFIFVTAPFFNLLLSAYINKVEVLEYIEYIYHNHKLMDNIVWFLLPVVTGLSILRFRTWSYVLLLSFICFISVYFYLEFRSSPSMSLLVFAVFELMNLSIGFYFLLPPVRNVYTKPQLRWWEQKPRYVFEHPVIIEARSQITPGQIKNISVGGLLLVTDLKFDRGDRFAINIEIYDKKFKLECQVAHAAKDSYGVFFTDVQPSQNEFNKSIDILAANGAPLRTQMPTRKESLKSWVGELKKGQGFVPKPDSRKEA